MPGTANRQFLSKLEARREQVRAATEGMLLEARDQGRQTLSEGEDRRYRQARSDLTALDAQIAEYREDLARSQMPAHLSRLSPTNPQTTSRNTTMNHADARDLIYRRGDPHQSWCRDLIRLSLNLDSDGESRARLGSHAQQVVDHPAFQEHRDLSRVDGSGGYAVPPAWLMNQYVELARPGRAFANLVQRQPLPGGTDSINIPKVLTGTATAVQTADNTPVQDVDLTDTFINAPVRTISGQQGVAIQLLDQSPIAFDDLVFRDLIADYASQLDTQCLSGSGTNGQVLGVNNTPNIGSIAVSTVDIQGVYSAIANAIQTIHTTRFQPPEVVVMHPRRWGWFLALLDTQQRPLFLPDANRPYNAAGILEEVASQQVVGSIQGLPVVTDPNIETNLGTGGDEDPVYVLRASDVVLWESGIRARVLPETKAQNLTVLLQLYGYLAFSAARYPASIVEISGLSAPTW
ncbi:phage major capsid protein [Mycobacterium sp.]|uniref:phage major capsid protein n=1 Tax=Mycobacterium sp. TaxID=1785 RepID=UPI003F96CE2E